MKVIKKPMKIPIGSWKKEIPWNHCQANLEIKAFPKLLSKGLNPNV